MRSLISFTTLPAILLWAAPGCASIDMQDPLANDSVDETAPDGELTAARNSTTYYFEIAKDLRLCPSPGCGGWFLNRLNFSSTQCHDGTWASECYTPVLDWSSSHLAVAEQTQMLDACYQYANVPGVHVIVSGRFARTNFTTPRSSLGRFLVTEAWLAVGEEASAGTFVRVKDNGVRCFAAPCPSLTETALNTTKSSDISALDYTPAAMTYDQINTCNQETFTTDGLLLAGNGYTFVVNGTTAEGRTVTNGYYRLISK
jgi:hypothetical protein